MTARYFAGPRLIVVCVLALGMLTLPASSAIAVGQHSASAHHATAKGKGKGKGKGKKHKKKKPATTVIVKCASVAVTCKGTPGPQGPAGTPGANGTNGSAIVLRARFSGAVAAVAEKTPPGCKSFSCIEGANVPISPSAWTEGPSEDDQMIGSVTLALPDKTECGVETENSKHEKEFEPAEAFVIVSVGNVVEGFTLAEGGEIPRTVTISLFGASLLVFELEAIESEVGSGSFIGNGSSQTHTITVKAIDDCLTKHTTVSNVAIDILAST